MITESFSEWLAPIVIFREPGGYRLFLDIRKLNAVSNKDAYPLLYMSDILKQLKAIRYICKTGMGSGFNQIPLEKTSQEYTAFTVPGRGLF